MKKPLYILIIIWMVLSLAACNLPTNSSGNENLAATLAAQTLQAMMTQVVDEATQSPVQATATPQQLKPSSTPLPTNTQVVIQPTNTDVPIPCDLAQFVRDVSVPDGTSYTAGTHFTKTWRLKNVGTCTWTTNYSLVFVNGSLMGADSINELPGSVAPGQSIDLSVDMIAPNSSGTYQGNWKLRNASNVTFGTGAGADFPFFVEIKVNTVISGDGTYSFVDNYCDADWRSGSGDLPCPGKDGDARGFVFRQSSPRLENGSVDNDPALLVHPQSINDGVIRGQFPPIAVKAGTRFQTIVGCEYNAKSCNVKFQLDYQIGSDSIKTLASWNEAYEGQFTQVSVDLSSLAGNNVSFILTVLANGSSNGDRAQWLAPRIEKVTPTVTPTPTLTPTVTRTPTPTVTKTVNSYPYP